MIGVPCLQTVPTSCCLFHSLVSRNFAGVGSVAYQAQAVNHISALFVQRSVEFGGSVTKFAHLINYLQSCPTSQLHHSHAGNKQRDSVGARLSEK